MTIEELQEKIKEIQFDYLDVTGITERTGWGNVNAIDQERFREYLAERLIKDRLVK